MNVKEREQFLKEGFSEDQILQIEAGQDAGIDTSSYADKRYLAMQMEQLRIGLMNGVSVEVYANPEFDWFQMEEIRKGLEAKLDVSAYALPEINYKKMRRMRDGLMKGIDLSEFLKFSARVMKQIHLSLLSGIEILPYVNEGYDAEQLQEIRLALEKGVDIGPYLSKDYRGVSLQQIRKGLEAGIDVSVYANIHYSWRNMRELRLGMLHQVDIQQYVNPLYSWDQMKEIRLGLEQGLDVGDYRRLRYPAEEMRRKRLALLDDIRRARENEEVQLEDFAITFESGGMEAYITMHTRNKVITRESLLDLLKQNKVIKGIQESAVTQILEGKYKEDPILIAKGELPRTGDDGWYEYFFRTNVEKKPKQLEDGSVDYQDVEWFEIVKKDQKLVYYHGAKEGIDGYNVSGVTVKARKGIEKRILTGKGFRMDDDKKTYYAEFDGMVRWSETTLEITKHLEIDEITMATGNLKFDGSIHIRGDVENGTRVQAADDIVIDGNVGAAIIESGGNVILKRGMNASGRGMVKAEKGVESKFFETVKVESNGNIQVNSCLNSQLYAGGTIISMLVLAGGTASADKGFKLYDVGNKANIHTVLKVENNDSLFKERKQIVDGIASVNHEIEVFNNSYEDFRVKFPPEVRNTMPVFLKIENALFTKRKQLDQLNTLLEEIDERVKQSGEVKIVISGRAYEGVVVDMGGNRWKAKDHANITLKRMNNQLDILPNV